MLLQGGEIGTMNMNLSFRVKLGLLLAAAIAAGAVVILFGISLVCMGAGGCL
jgi:hypothetical protein